MVGNITAERGFCTPPFLELSNFDSTVGCKNRSGKPDHTQHLADPLTDLPGRFCAPVPSVNGTVNCCLPCPITSWVYSDGESCNWDIMKEADTEFSYRVQ